MFLNLLTVSKRVLEETLVKWMGGERVPFALRPLLLALSLLYRCGLQLRHLFYDRGWLRVHAVSVPVVSIGNIACGGTGKTPLVRLLAEQISSCGKQVAILSRGYRSLSERQALPFCVQDRTLTSAIECGDEPYFLASVLPHVPVWVNRNRVLAAHQAIQAGAQLILLDDGLQHRALHRDVEIVVLDGKDPLGQNCLLPAGPLRDLPSRLAAADLIVLNGVGDIADLPKMQKMLFKFSQAPILVVEMEASPEQSEILRSRKVGAFCAIGNPQRFFTMLQQLPVELIATCTAPDHRPFDIDQLAEFAVKCRGAGAEMLVCTQKDAVKLSGINLFELPVIVLDAHLRIIVGKNHLEDVLRDCC